MAKRNDLQNNDLQNTTQKTQDWATQILHYNLYLHNLFYKYNSVIYFMFKVRLVQVRVELVQ
jgi:hypothetical protein